MQTHTLGDEHILNAEEMDAHQGSSVHELDVDQANDRAVTA